MASQIIPLLQLMVKQKGSDLHLAVASPPMVRINGDIAKVEMPPLTQADIEAMMKEILSTEELEELHQNKVLDFARKIPNVGLFR